MKALVGGLIHRQGNTNTIIRIIKTAVVLANIDHSRGTRIFFFLRVFLRCSGTRSLLVWPDPFDLSRGGDLCLTTDD